jgi:uncharacterized protein YfaQ (DUF2300 family)
VPDLIDAAQDNEQQTREACIRELTFTRERQLAPSCECYNCGARLGVVGAFCDADCRNDYQHRQRMQKLGGGSC